MGVAGSAIGELLRAFGMKVIGVTRTPRAIAGFDDVVARGMAKDPSRRQASASELMREATGALADAGLDSDEPGPGNSTNPRFAHAPGSISGAAPVAAATSADAAGHAAATRT